MKKTTWPTEWKIAHRGLHSETIPENSKAAFRAAIERGYAIELDVQPSLEGTPMVFHDANLSRMTGLDAFIYYMLESDLLKTALHATDEMIPSLKNVLEFVHGQVPLLIEIKADAPVVSLTNAVIELLNDYKGDVAVHSFSPKIVRHLKKKAPHLIRGQISSDFKTAGSMSKFRTFYLSRMHLNGITKPDFITYDIRALPNPYVRRFKAKGNIALGYTAKNKKAYDEALKWVDNAVFEGFLL